MNSLGITADSHSKLLGLKGLEGKKIKIIGITEGEKATEEGIFFGFGTRGILIKKSKLEVFSDHIPFIGYDTAIVTIEDEEGNIVFNNATEDVVDFFRENLPTYFSGSDGKGIVKANNTRVNAILEGTFGDLYPKLEMIT